MLPSVEKSSAEKTPTHSPVAVYLRSLLYMYIALLLRIFATAPLAALFLFPGGSVWRGLAFLAPLLWFFLLMPLRFSFAQAIVGKASVRFFSFDSALSLSRYGEKLGEALLHLLNVVKWGIPLFAMLGYGYLQLKDAEFPALIASVSALGGSVNRIIAPIVVLFGGAAAATEVQPLVEGIYAILAILGVGLLFLLYGIMRNSAYRYIWALAIRDDRSPRGEASRRLQGRRARQFVVALINIALSLPFLAAIMALFRSVLGNISFNGMMVMSADFLPTTLVKSASPLLAAVFCFYLPLLPIRRMLTSYFAIMPLPTPKAPGATPSPAPVDSPALEVPDELAEDSFADEAPEEPRNDVDPSAFTIGQ